MAQNAEGLYEQAADSLRLNQLMAEFGQNKILPKGHELQALVALSHYPQLKEVPITFKFKKAKVAHTSQPKPSSLLRARKHRKYEIIISNELKESLHPTMLANMPYNAQIGVLGHELAHTAEYETMSNWELMGLAVKYLFKKFRIRFERATDQRTIDHGLGRQLLEWSKTVHHHLTADGRGENYMTPEEIKAKL